MGMLSAQFATCYKCEQQDKKGNLQRCLGWQLLKRLEDDATEFNKAQADRAEQDAHGSPGPAFGGATSGGSAAQPTSQQPAQPSSLTAAVQDAAAAAPAEEELRESKRFELFNRGASLQNYANCPFQQPPTPEGRHFHQTCLGRGAHLNMSRKILHWSGRSNSNKRKKADKLSQPDNVKVTGRHALCSDCVAALAQALNKTVEEMLPPESNPERRQVKVNSRHRLHHAAELPNLGRAGNAVFCAYVSPAGRVGVYQNENFKQLRKIGDELDGSCINLEALLRKQAMDDRVAEREAVTDVRKRRRAERAGGGADSGSGSGLGHLQDAVGVAPLQPANMLAGQSAGALPQDLQQLVGAHLRSVELQEQQAAALQQQQQAALQQAVQQQHPTLQQAVLPVSLSQLPASLPQQHSLAPPPPLQQPLPMLQPPGPNEAAAAAALSSVGMAPSMI